MKNAVNRWALKPLPERICKAHSTLRPFPSPASCGTFYFAAPDLINNAEKPRTTLLSFLQINSDSALKSVAHPVATVQNSAFHFFGEPDFLPTTAGLLC